MIDYLTKPFGRDRLRESVVRGIDGTRRRATRASGANALEGKSSTPAAPERRARELTIDSDAALDALLSC